MLESSRSEGARLLGATRMQDDAEIAARNLNTIRAALKPDKQILFDNAIDNLDLQDPIAVTKIIHQYQKIPFIYKVLEYWRAALLSALITQVRNTTGNTLFFAFDVPVRAFAGGLDVVRAKVRGKERTVYAGEALKLIYGGVRAVPQATREAMKQFRDEYYIYGSQGQMHRMNIEAGLRAPAIKGVKGAIIRIPFRFLGMIAVTKIIHQYQKIPFIYKVLEYWKSSLLSALITQVRNTTGNTLFFAFDVPVRAFAGGLDVVRVLS